MKKTLVTAALIAAFIGGVPMANAATMAPAAASVTAYPDQPGGDLLGDLLGDGGGLLDGLGL